MASPDIGSKVPASLLADFMAGLSIMDRFGLTEGFGHLSARTPEGIVITPAWPPGLAGEEDLLLLSASGDVLCPGTGKPKALETVLHMGIYQAREDVGAICRTHSPWAVAWGLRAEAFQPAHGFGLMMGASVPYHPEGNLVSSPAAALSAARTLGDARGLFLKGNGLAVVGTTLREAVIRALYLEEACRGVLCSGGVPDRARFTEAERDDRSAWHDAELARAWAYYSARASSRIPK